MLRLAPRQTKYKKAQKGRVSLTPLNKSSLSFATYGIQTQCAGKLTGTQIHAVNQTLLRTLKGYNPQIIWRVFPNIPVTQKTLGVPMGKGKGVVDHWICKIRPGQILLEISSTSQPKALKALRAASYKLPLKPLKTYVKI